MKTVSVLCRSNNHPASAMFSERKVYAVTRSEQGTYWLKDDNGHPRCITLEDGKGIFPLGTATPNVITKVYQAEFDLIDMHDDIEEQIADAEREGLNWYIQFGKVRICVPDGDDYYFWH
ncbi:hypothetical protein [Neptuniibacter sp. QD37_11]|uniref:hypothetical protein n=1 Tax=Neptuniibacter sp. QD37_11 TaxID=3398209 RepID=UPI0039F52AD1